MGSNQIKLSIQKTSTREVFCIGDPNEIVNSHGSRRGPLSRRKARASFNRAPQLPAPNSTRSNLSWALYQYKKTSAREVFCIGDPNEIVNSHGSRRGPLSRRKARASFNRAPQLPAPNSTRSNLSWALYQYKKTSAREVFCIGDPNEIRTRIATVKGWCPNH